MSIQLDIIYEMNCDDCDSVFELHTSEENEHEPIYCPFCGNEIIDEEIEEEEEDVNFFDDLEQFEEKE